MQDIMLAEITEGMKIRIAAMEDLDGVAGIEKACFPAEKAASREQFSKRLSTYRDSCWILEENGLFLSCINGMPSNDCVLVDAMFDSTDFYEEKGDWFMVFGVVTRPGFQGKRLASCLMCHVIRDVKKQGRKGMILTCLEEKIGFYERFGFIDEGLSPSTHGGKPWRQMILRFRR